MAIYTVLVVLHVTAAALLLGVGVGFPPSAARKALARGPEAFQVAVETMKRIGIVAPVSSLVVLLTGVGLIVARGGFAAATPNFHIALGLMLAAFVFSALVMKPATASLVRSVDGGAVDEALARTALKKLSMGTGIFHGLWLVLLLLMYIRP